MLPSTPFHFILHTLILPDKTAHNNKFILSDTINFYIFIPVDIIGLYNLAGY